MEALIVIFIYLGVAGVVGFPVYQWHRNRCEDCRDSTDICIDNSFHVGLGAGAGLFWPFTIPVILGVMFSAKVTRWVKK